MVQVKLSRISGLLFLDIGLWSVKEKKFRNMAILLDTGASVSTISKHILASLGYRESNEKTLVTTAGGPINVSSITIEKIKVGIVELSDVDVYSHIFPDECFSDGVLGMNILNLFNFKVDLDHEIIELESRETII